MLGAKPPLPAHKGLFDCPTVINNVISLASVPVIMDRGAAFYKDFGMGRSRGTIPLQIAGNVRNGGLFEAAFGLTLGAISKPSPMPGSLDAMTPQALAGRWLAQKL